jgi:hypothetical protein
MTLKTVQVFISSPTDVEHERQRAERVVERLNGQYSGVVRLIPIRWEQKFYEARASFQEQIPEASSCDLVIGILWSRLGSELPPEMPPMPSGEPYPSGTAYEVLTAIERSKEEGHPSVYLFRKTASAVLPIEDETKRALVIEQLDRLKAFWERWIKTKEGHFKAGYQEFANPDQFEAQLERLLRDWLDERVLNGRTALWPINTKGSPFRGLAAFGAKHAPVFFGRGSDITRAVDALKDAAERGSPFLLLVGSSGSGKSSLARAGLSPRLTAPGVVGAVDEWRTAVMRPGENKDEPTLALSTHLFDGPKDIPPDEEGCPFALPELSKSSHKTPQRLAKALASGDAASVLWALDSIADERQAQGGYDRPVRVDLLLIVDQLDELFAADVSEEEREVFAKALTALAATGRVWVIATLRTDLYERLQQIAALLALKQNGAAYDLAPPGPAELAEIVRKPAEAAGLAYERNSKTGQSLDEKLLEDAGRADMLPLLQFALQELFERRAIKDADALLTFAAYSEIGGLDGAIDQRAEQALAALGEAEQASLPRLLRQLAVPAREKNEGTSLTIRSVSVSEANFNETAKRLVKALVDARILLSSGEEGEAAIRLAHERVLKSWGRAREIVRDNADFYRIRSNVDDQLARWQAAGKNRDLLISKGVPLAEAESIVRRYPGELSPQTLAYIDASGKRARLRQRFTAAAAILFAFMTVGATVAGAIAWQAERRGSALLDQIIYLASGVTAEQRDKAQEQFSATAKARYLQGVYLVAKVDGETIRPLATAWAYAPYKLATAAYVTKHIRKDSLGTYILIASNGERFKIKAATSHPAYEMFKSLAATVGTRFGAEFSPAFLPCAYCLGTIEIETAKALPVTLDIASDSEIAKLAPGMAVAIVGFDGELSEGVNGLAPANPIVRVGNIGALKDVFLLPASPEHRLIIQHNILVAQGMGGGPMLNANGKVIGVMTNRSPDQTMLGEEVADRRVDPGAHLLTLQQIKAELEGLQAANVNFAQRIDVLSDLEAGRSNDWVVSEEIYWKEAAARFDRYFDVALAAFLDLAKERYGVGKAQISMLGTGVLDPGKTDTLRFLVKSHTLYAEPGFIYGFIADSEEGTPLGLVVKQKDTSTYLRDAKDPRQTSERELAPYAWVTVPEPMMLEVNVWSFGSQPATYSLHMYRWLESTDAKAESAP